MFLNHIFLTCYFWIASLKILNPNRPLKENQGNENWKLGSLHGFVIGEKC
jgi:hypothetical protein